MPDLNEQQIRKLVEEAVNQLGSNASGTAVEQVVHEAVQRMQPGSVTPPPPVQAPGQNRIIVTAFGKNRTGILAGLTGVLAEANCDILDLSQKILQEFFTIMLLVDISSSSLSFDQVKEKVVQTGDTLGLKVIIQHEDIFNTMHRV